MSNQRRGCYCSGGGQIEIGVVATHTAFKISVGGRYAIFSGSENAGMQTGASAAGGCQYGSSCVHQIGENAGVHRLAINPAGARRNEQPAMGGYFFTLENFCRGD